MLRERSHSLLKDQRGATAATFGLALFALVAIGGLGFDYARLAGMDSELQNAADQAALAGASQLDGKNGACLRASAAASDPDFLTNLTLLANDGTGTAVTITPAADCSGSANIRFYKVYIEKGDPGNEEADDDSNANFIEVTIGTRTANYAFTPLVAAIRGDARAAAVAGIGSAICKVPPVMMCNPDEENSPVADPDFVSANYIGKGIRLIANDGGGNYGPGNFGYLENDGGNGQPAIAAALGLVAPPGECVAVDGVTTKPGEQVSVLDYLNTRFDIYDSVNNVCGADGASCPPSANTRKDVIRNETGNGNLTCSFGTGNGHKGWKLPSAPYLPSSPTTPLTEAEGLALSPMGYPRDMCHAVSNAGSCADGTIGDGIWDVMAYFRSNRAAYGSVPPSGDLLSWFGTENPTRYQVYQREMANGSLLDPQVFNSETSRGAPVCVSPGITPTTTSPDRRVLPIAVVNCNAEGVGGKTPDVTVKTWLDVFLVEPSLARSYGTDKRTEKSDVYVEVIREIPLGGGGGTAGNTIRRDVPYLIE